MSTVVPRTPSRLVVVLRTPQVPYVLLASLIGRLPLGAAPLALLLYAHGTMSAAMTGLLVGSYTAGTAIGQPMLSRMADRWRQAPVVLAAIVLSTAGFLVITLAPADGTVIAAAFAAGLGAPPFEACLRVLWRVLVGEHHLHSAYTVDVTVQELIFIAGPLMTVAAVNLGGPTGGLIAIATAQAVGALLFLGSPAVRRWRGEVATRHWAGPLRSARLRPLLFATMLVGSSLGCMTIAVAAYSVGRGSPSLAGWLLTANAIGALIGGVIFAHRPRRLAAVSLPAIVAVMAATFVPPLLTPSFGVMLVLVGASGVALPAVLTGVFTETDRVAPPGTAAEAFAWVATAFGVGSALGAAANGWLVDVAGAGGGRSTVAFVLAPIAILAAAALLRLSRADMTE